MTPVAQKPAMWRTVHVIDVCETVSVGIVIQPSQYYVEASEGIRAFRSANVGENRIVDRDWVYLSPEGHRANSKSSLRTGDVLVVRSGAPGTACVVTEEYAGSNCIDIVFARPHQDQVLPEYLAEFTNSPVGRRHVLGTQGGLALKHFNVSAYKQLELLLPEIAEQKKIVDLLAAWDTAIQKTEQLIAAKERHRNALTQRLYMLSDRQGKPTRFSDLFNESMESGSSGRHARKISVKLYGKGVLAKEEKRHGSEQTQYFVRRAGQLIYSKLDFLNGAFGIIPTELDGYESTLDLPAFDIAPTVNPIWLLCYLARPKYYTRQVGLARGQRKARRVHPSDLLASSLHVPPRDLQDRVAEILTSSQSDLDKSRQLLDALKTQKRGLMQKLLTGQWRLPAQGEAD